MAISFNSDIPVSKLLSFKENRLQQDSEQSNRPRIPEQDIVPGDVELVSIIYSSLDGNRSLDLMDFVKMINIYEDIFTPSIIAEFDIQDTIDIQNNYEMSAGDYIQLAFRTPQDEELTEMIFGIQTLSGMRPTPNLKLKSYTITSISPEGLRNSNLSVQFKQKDSASALVRRVFDDHIKTTKDVNIDPSRLIEDFPPMTAMRPFQVINYLIRFSYSSQYNSNAFVFFENKRGFFFTTIEKLISEGVKAQEKGNQFTDKEFFYDIASNEDQRNMSFRNILSFQKSSINPFENASKVSTIINTYDFVRGKYIRTMKKIGDESFELLEGDSSGIEPTFDSTYGKETSNVSFVPITTDTMPEDYGNFVANRTMFANKLSQDIVRILVYGDTQLAVGDVIKCNFPNFSADIEDQNREEVESGNYLITSLRHMILNTDRPQHLIAMECARDR